MEEESDLFAVIVGKWFWVTAAFFLLIQFGDWINVHWFWGLLLAGLIGLINVATFFGLAAWVLSRFKLSPNILLYAVLLFLANIITLLVLSPFVPNDFRGLGDYAIGAIVMVVLVGTAQSIPDVFKPGG